MHPKKVKTYNEKQYKIMSVKVLQLHVETLDEISMKKYSSERGPEDVLKKAKQD
jgi:hypothetical protein